MRNLAFVTGFALAVTAAGCGSVEPGDPTKFIGTWTYDSGNVTGSCIGMTFTQDLAGTSIVLTEGASSDLLLTVTADCQIRFNLSGKRASAVPGQMCTLNVSTFGPQTMTVKSWTMDTSDGVSMTTAMKGTANVTFTPMGTTTPIGPIPCDVTGSGALTRQP